ncbi:MAG: hypothetical protein ACP5J8_02450 [Minisyncoccia bacterium]
MNILTLNSFSGGMNRKVSPLLARPDEAYTVRNIRLSRIGTIQKRKGYVQVGNTPDTNPVRFLYPYYKTGASPLKQLLRISGNKFYYLNETNNTWVDATGSNTLYTSGMVDATTYANLAIFVNAASSVLKWDGTTLSALGGNPPNGTSISTFKDRVYIAKGSYIYFSDVANAESWQGFNSISVGLNDGDEIVAIIPYFDSLIIFKHNSIWAYNVDADNQPLSVKPLAYGVGCDALQSIWIVNGVLHWASRQGIYSFSGRAPEKISYRVEDIFKNTSNANNFIGWVDGDLYHLYVGSIDGYQNCVLFYDTVLDYFAYDSNLDVQSATVYINASNIQRQYFGDSNGNVWLLWEGYKDKGTQDIEMEYTSLLFQLSEPLKPIELNEVGWRMSYDAYSPITIELSVNNSDWRRVATAQKAISKDKTVQSIFPQAMDFKFRLHEISGMQGPEILEIIINGELPETSNILPYKFAKR